MNFWQRVRTVFTSPGKAVEGYDVEIKWSNILTPIIILIVLGWIHSVIYNGIIVDYRVIIDQSIQAQISSGAISEADARAILQGKNLDMAAEQERNRRVIVDSSFIVINTFLWLFGQALALWLCMLIFNRAKKLSYKTVLGIVALSAVFSWIQVVIRLILSISTGMSYMNISPAFMIPALEPNTVLFFIVSRFDPLQIWAVVFMGLGLGSLISNRRKGLTIALILWVIWGIIVVAYISYLIPYREHMYIPV